MTFCYASPVCFGLKLDWFCAGLYLVRSEHSFSDFSRSASVACMQIFSSCIYRKGIEKVKSFTNWIGSASEACYFDAYAKQNLISLDNTASMHAHMFGKNIPIQHAGLAEADLCILRALFTQSSTMVQLIVSIELNRFLFPNPLRMGSDRQRRSSKINI